MAVTKHSIVLNLTGDAQRQMDALARKMKTAGKDMTTAMEAVGKGVPTPTAPGAMPVTPPLPLPPGTRPTPPIPPQRFPVTPGAGQRGTALNTALQVGEQIAAGGTTTGAAGIAVGGLGGMLTRFGGKAAGVGLAATAAGSVMGFAGRMSDQFEGVVEQLRQVAAVTGGFNKFSKMQNQVKEAALTYAVDPSVVRNITMTIARQTGRADVKEAAQIGLMSDAMAVQTEQSSQLVALQKRFNTGVTLKDAMSYGVASGLKRGQIGEFLGGVQDLQEQLLESGVVDKGEVQKVLASLGAVSETLRGRFGARVAGGIQARIQAAGAGGGGLLTTALFAAWQKQTPGMSYYETRKRAEMGLGGGNLEVLLDFLKSFSDKEQQALMASEMFDISLHNAEELMKVSKVSTKAAKEFLDSQTENYRASEETTKKQAQVIKRQTKEAFGEVFNNIENAVTNALREYLRVGETERERETRRELQNVPWAPPEAKYQYEVFDVENRLRKETGFDIGEVWKRVLTEANKGGPEVTEKERETAMKALVAAFQDLKEQLIKGGKKVDINVKLNNKVISVGKMNEQ